LTLYAGTTRDPIDEEIDFGGETWRFIDTAGIRKHAHQASGTEYYAMLRTETALERGEVAILVIDASEPIAEQDLRIMSKVVDSGRALVIAMNKWDLVDEDRREALEREKERELNQVEWAERINISAKTGWHKDRLAPALKRALDKLADAHSYFKAQFIPRWAYCSNATSGAWRKTTKDSLCDSTKYLSAPVCHLRVGLLRTFLSAVH